MPAVAAVGSKVTDGSLNRTGGFVMRTERVGADTPLSKIVHMVATAQRSRAPIQRMADRHHDERRNDGRWPQGRRQLDAAFNIACPRNGRRASSRHFRK